jgi:hypothetical protein
MTYGADGMRRKKSVTPSGGSPSDTIFVYDGQNLFQERNVIFRPKLVHEFSPKVVQ